MKRLLLLLTALVASLTIAHAGLIERYQARLGSAAHYNSNGQRLWSAPAIIRQERANFYNGIREPESQGESFFSDYNNRARLESLLENGWASQDVVNEIVNGTPLIQVDVFDTGVKVFILSH